MSSLRGDELPGQRPTTARSAPRIQTVCVDEGLARLEYLVAQQRRLGLIVGPAGSGKTFLAKQFVRAARLRSCDVLHADLLGVDGRELLWTLVSQLGIRRHIREACFALWRALADRLIVMAEGRRHRSSVVGRRGDRAAADALGDARSRAFD